MSEIDIEPITANAFAAFGALLSRPLDHAAVWSDRPDAGGCIEIICATATASPDRHTLAVMERHRHSTQAFFPLDVDAYIVVVAPDADDGQPDLRGLRAFHVPGTVAIQYRADVWHAPMAVLSGTGVFAMYVHNDGTDADCEFTAVSVTNIRLHEASAPAALVCPGQ